MKENLLIMLMLLLIGCSHSPTVEDNYTKGQNVYETGNYELAVYYFKKAALHGHSDAQMKLGDCYNTGTGVKRDTMKAAYWWKKASKERERFR